MCLEIEAATKYEVGIFNVNYKQSFETLHYSAM